MHSFNKFNEHPFFFGRHWEDENMIPALGKLTVSQKTSEIQRGQQSALSLDGRLRTLEMEGSGQS